MIVRRLRWRWFEYRRRMDSTIVHAHREGERHPEATGPGDCGPGCGSNLDWKIKHRESKRKR